MNIFQHVQNEFNILQQQKPQFFNDSDKKTIIGKYVQSSLKQKMTWFVLGTCHVFTSVHVQASYFIILISLDLYIKY